MKFTNKYDDIIHLPHHVSKKHPQMAAADRAAQFSPFAALTGHGAAIKETARLTDEKPELDESTKRGLDEQLQILINQLQHNIHVTVKITYFVPDEKKRGGAYHTIKDKVKKMDIYRRNILLMGGTLVPIDDIVGIDLNLGMNYV